MPLMKCPDCGAEVSDRAPSCPKCNHPFAQIAADKLLNDDLRRVYEDKKLIGATIFYMERKSIKDMGEAKSEVERRLGLPPGPPPRKLSLPVVIVGYLLLFAAIWMVITGRIFK